MPPQQGDGLLDLFDGAFGFGAHDLDMASDDRFVK